MFKKTNKRLLGFALIVGLGLILFWLVWAFYNTQLLEIDNALENLDK